MAARKPREKPDRGAGELVFPLEASVGAVLRMAHLAYAQDLQSHLARHDIPVGMWFYLRALWEEDGLTQRELSRRVCATEPTTAQQLKNMERRGYVERRRSTTDRRNSHVHLTRAGRALRRQLLPYAVEVNAAALHGLGSAEIRALRETLGRIGANLRRRQAEADAAAAAASSPAPAGRRRTSRA